MELRSLRSQQISHDAQPFGVQWVPANGLASPTVPIFCIALIAFLAMQVGVHPRTLGALVLLGRFVRSLPIAFAIPPKSGEGERKFRRRVGLSERRAEIVQGHGRWSDRMLGMFCVGSILQWFLRLDSAFVAFTTTIVAE
jgi:hypothetical protein